MLLVEKYTNVTSGQQSSDITQNSKRTHPLRPAMPLLGIHRLQNDACTWLFIAVGLGKGRK